MLDTAGHMHAPRGFLVLNLHYRWWVAVGAFWKPILPCISYIMVTYLWVFHLSMQQTRVWSLGWEGPLEKEMATHSSILAWRIPWTGEPGGLQSMGLQRVDTTQWLNNNLLIHGRVCESYKHILLNLTLNLASLKLDHRNVCHMKRGEVWQTWK